MVTARLADIPLAMSCAAVWNILQKIACLEVSTSSMADPVPMSCRSWRWQWVVRVVLQLFSRHRWLKRRWGDLNPQRKDAANRLTSSFSGHGARSVSMYILTPTTRIRMGSICHGICTKPLWGCCSRRLLVSYEVYFRRYESCCSKLREGIKYTKTSLPSNYV